MWKHHGSVAALESLPARAILQENRKTTFPDRALGIAAESSLSGLSDRE
jgi:hypothetical protein